MTPDGMRSARRPNRSLIQLERCEVAGVHAHEPRAGVERAAQLVGRVRLHQRGHAELRDQLVQFDQTLLVERRDDQQYQVGARGAGLEHLVRIGDELLAQHRDRHGVADGLEVGERTVEPPLLGQHADRARPAGLVRDGECGRVRDRGERPARGARALHLGDDLDAVRRGESRQGVERGRTGERLRLDLGERTLGAPPRQRLRARRRRGRRARISGPSGCTWSRPLRSRCAS